MQRFIEVFIRLKRKIDHYKNYNLYDKWDFIYMQYNLNDKKLRFGSKYDKNISIANQLDLQQIQSDIYPNMSSRYDQRYFRFLGEKDRDCFLYDDKGKLIHYSWVFYDINKSPLASTPLGTQQFQNKVVFWGPTFTIPLARGVIYPYIFSYIVRSLINNKKAERIVNFVYKYNPGAFRFYQTLGFVPIDNQPVAPIFIRIARLLDRLLFRKTT